MNQEDINQEYIINLLLNSNSNRWNEFIKQNQSFGLIIKNKTITGDRNFSNYIFPKFIAFENVEFTGNVNFNQSTFDSVEFIHVKFNNGARFANTTFNLQSKFEHTLFQQTTKDSEQEDKAYFGDIHFKDIIIFDNVKFKTKVTFVNTTFDKDTLIINTTFEDTAWFNQIKFKEGVSFNKTKFCDIVSFGSIEHLGLFNLSSTKFKLVPYFRDDLGDIPEFNIDNIDKTPPNFWDSIKTLRSKNKNINHMDDSSGWRNLKHIIQTSKQNNIISLIKCTRFQALSEIYNWCNSTNKNYEEMPNLMFKILHLFFTNYSMSLLLRPLCWITSLILINSVILYLNNITFPFKYSFLMISNMIPFVNIPYNQIDDITHISWYVWYLFCHLVIYGIISSIGLTLYTFYQKR